MDWTAADMADHKTWRRFVDEHSFQFTTAHGTSSCRLQILTDGTSFLAVAVQFADGREGASLTNNAEQLAAAARSRYLPSLSSDLPVLLHYVDHGQLDMIYDAGSSRTFRKPSKTERAAVDRAADLNRGSSAPQPLQPRVSNVVFVQRPLETLPHAHELFRASDCMATGRQSRPHLDDADPRRSPGSSCCWYHSIDWARASTLIWDALLDEAQGGLNPVETLSAAHVRGLVADGALSLFDDPIYIATGLDEGESITNGQHRLEAMRDQDVSWTVVQQSSAAPIPALALRPTSDRA